MTLSCTVVPAAARLLEGTIEMPVRDGTPVDGGVEPEPTLTCTEPATEPMFARTEVVPFPIPDTRPVPSTVATAAFPVVQVAMLETSTVVPAWVVAVAVSFVVEPAAT